MNSAALRVTLLCAFVFCSVSLWAQTKTVSGKVSSDDNKPLAGATVAVKGKATATQTNANGEYSINTAAGETLLFSYTGFVTQEISVGDEVTIDLALMSDAKGMEEVIVVGYGTQSKRNITTSISKLDNQVLQSAPRSNLGSAFQGTLPGLRVVNATGQPGANPNILLRGGASINSPGAPLVV